MLHLEPSSSAHPSSISFANDPTQSVIAFPDPTTTSTTTTSSSTILNLFPTITTTTSSSSTIETASETAAVKNDSSSISSGGVAGIVVGVVAAAAIGLFALLFVRRKSKQRPMDNRRISSFGQAEFFAGPSPAAIPPAMTTITPPTYGSTHANNMMPYYDIQQQQAPPNSTFAPAPFIQQSPPPVQQQQQQHDDPFQRPPLGTYTVVSTYTPTLDDEITVHPGDHVQVYTEYDDGWCLGVNLTRGQQQGVFPKHCLLPESPSLASSHADGSSGGLAIDNKHLSKRGSSLYSG